MNENINIVSKPDKLEVLRFKAVLTFTLIIFLLGLYQPVSAQESITDEDKKLLDLISDILGIDSNNFYRLVNSLNTQEKMRLEQEFQAIGSLSGSQILPLEDNLALFGGIDAKQFLEDISDTAFPQKSVFDMIKSTHFVIFFPHDDPNYKSILSIFNDEETVLKNTLALLELAYAYNRALGSDVELDKSYPVTISSRMNPSYVVDSGLTYTYINLPPDIVQKVFASIDINNRTTVMHEGTHMMMMEGRDNLTGREDFGLQEATATAVENLLLESFQTSGLETMIGIDLWNALSEDQMTEENSYGLYGVIYSALQRGYNVLETYYQVYNQDKSELTDFKKVLTVLDNQMGEDEPGILAGFYIGILNNQPNRGLYNFDTAYLYTDNMEEIKDFPISDIDSVDIFSQGVGTANYFNLKSERNFIPKIPKGQNVYVVTLAYQGEEREVINVDKVQGDTFISGGEGRVLVVVNENYQS